MQRRMLVRVRKPFLLVFFFAAVVSAPPGARGGTVLALGGGSYQGAQINAYDSATGQSRGVLAYVGSVDRQAGFDQSFGMALGADGNVYVGLYGGPDENRIV